MERLFEITKKFVPQLIVLAFIIAGRGVNAQSPYPYAYSYAGIPYNTKSIVRNYDEQNVVVYYEESGFGYVSLVNVVTNTAITVPLDTGYVMNDMCILNDSVFLCGRYYYGLHQISNFYIGCIVAMNLNSFYSSSVLVTYFNPSYWIRMDFKRIKRFEYVHGPYNDTYAKFLLVCDIYYPCDCSEPFPLYFFVHHYGSANNPSMCVENAVAEVSYPFSIGPSDPFTSQKVIRLMNPNEHTEFIHDVVETDNYVAFVGVEQGSSNLITLHICNKGSNILKSDYDALPPQVCDFDNYYTFSLGTVNGNPFYRACALEGDMIAIATQDEVSASSTSITVRTFDLSSHTMINAQELQCYSHPDFKDIAYLPNIHKVVLLYHGFFRQTNNYCDIFCTVDPYNTTASYVTQGITDNVFYQKFNSIDAMYRNYFISTGGKYGFVSDASSWGMGYKCYYMENYNVFNIGVISPGNDSYDYDQYRPTADINLKDTAKILSTIPSQCMVK